MSEKLGRTNSLNIEITSNYNSLNDIQKNDVLNTLEASSWDDWITTKNNYTLR